MNWFRSVASHAVTAGVVLLVVLAWLGLERRPSPAAPEGAAASKATVHRKAARPPAAVSPDEQVNIAVYDLANKSVVHITSEVEGLGFFGDETSSGSGSGFVIDEQGHILTNYHVIEGAQTLLVRLYDGSSHEAEVVGIDPSNDVAVVRIRAGKTPLIPLKLGDSSELVVGQKVLAVGNPFGLERTLTTGIISALDRTMKARNGRQIKGVIQTDAAINPGNSGGPLLNSRGEVIGMTTAIVSQVGQSAGIGFAVPINHITRILPQLIEHGRVIRADLGVRRVLVTDEGLLIVQLQEGGAAERAGLRPMQVRIERLGPYRIRRPDPSTADVIVAVDGKPVRTVDELLTEIEAHAPGETAIITVLRQGRLRRIEVVLGQSP